MNRHARALSRVPRRLIRSTTARWFPAAVFTAAVVEVGLRVSTLPRLARLLGVTLHLDDATTRQPRQRTRPRRHDPRITPRCRAASLALRIWPWGRAGACLRHALIAGFLLRRAQPELHIGVAHRDGTTVAHAWLTIDGVALDSAAQNYAPLVGRAR